MLDEPTYIPAAEIADGESLSVLLATATAPTALTVEHLFGTVVDARPKALRVQFEARRGATRSLWLPRRALVRVERDRHGVHARLARWWRADDYQERVLAACRHTDIQSVP